MRLKQYFVYIMTNRSGTLYVGVTSDLVHRVAQHRLGETGGFTSRYRIDRLVYFEVTRDIRVALDREKQIKSWSRAKKVALINASNPKWLDLLPPEPAEALEVAPRPQTVIPSEARNPGIQNQLRTGGRDSSLRSE